ncbi:MULTISPECIES: hypothetical protein [Bradyrhizobium]|uniref:hypothetical protein n=1 Tax=Bradyrhizobium TaxID=374 RepID=UPI001BAA6EAE|nr:hypothetical protein [Bradyrhizobium liaoningense]MBR0988384.1 hypothetical protein [Bradyrhizobium liaoningense]GMP12286.1 hypothetical protein TM239_65110 [Bradyrhizobium sp. TM239]
MSPRTEAAPRPVLPPTIPASDDQTDTKAQPSRPSAGLLGPSQAPAAPLALLPTTQTSAASVVSPQGLQAASDIVATALKDAHGDAIKTLQLLSIGCQQQPDEVRRLVLQDPATSYFVNDAAKQINAPLADTTLLPRQRADQAIRNLATAAALVDREFAGMLAEWAAVDYHQPAGDHRTFPTLAPLGPDGLADVVALCDQISGTARGDRVVADLASLTAWDAAPVLSAMQHGGGMAYALAHAHQAQMQGGSASEVFQTLAATTPGSQAAIQHETKADVEALAKHDGELAWLSTTLGPALSAERSQAAMDAYLAHKGPEWRAEHDRLNRAIVDDGSRLVRHMIAMGKLARKLNAGPELLGQWMAIANDDAARLAIEMAIQADPTLQKDDALNDIVDMLSSLKSHDGSAFSLATKGKLAFLGLRLTNVAATALVRRMVSGKLAGLDVTDPKRIEKAVEAIKGMADTRLARLLGISKPELDKAVAAVTKVSQVSTDDAAALAGLEAELKAAGRTAGAFARDTSAGQVMRGLALAVVALNLYNTVRFGHLDLNTVAKTGTLSTLGAQRLSEFLVSIGKADATKGFGRLAGAKVANVAAGEVLIAAFAVIEAVNSVRSGFGLGVPQDTAAALASAGSAVGFGLAVAPAFGAASWTGPAGIAVATVSVIGKAVYDGHKAAHQYEEPMRIMLRAAGFSPQASSELSKQSGYFTTLPGGSQVAFLARYAEYRQITPDQLLTWINGLSAAQLKQLSERVLFELGQGEDGRDRSSEIRTQWAGAALAQGVGYGPSEEIIFGVFDLGLDHERIPHPLAKDIHPYR